MNLKEIVNKKIYSAPLSEIKTERKCIINTINPHSYCVAKKDEVFAKALLSSDILLPDGHGIVLAAKVLEGKNIKRVAGADLHQYLLEQANVKSLRVFYLGTTQSTLQFIIKRIKEEFPNIQAESYAPPFKQEFSYKETGVMISAIKSFKPEILFVGMTAPKQEKWVYVNKDKIEADIICSIGAVFDFYAGTVKRSGTIWIKLGLEWLPRLLREPRRMWKRNFVSTPIFLWDMLKEKLR